MKKRLVYAVCSIFIGAALCLAQPGPTGPIPGKMAMMPHIGGGPGMFSSIENPPPMMLNPGELQKLMAEINIDKAVSSKIMTIARLFITSLNERIIKVQREELNIKEELLKDKPDMQVIQNAITKKSQLFGEIEFAQIKRDLEIKSLLTQDEYDRWKAALMQRMKQIMPDMLDKRMPNPDGKKVVPQK